MGTGYQVDVAALQDTVSKLRAVADSLEQPKSHTRYSTSIPQGALGTGFDGAEYLQGVHESMRVWIEEMIGTLQKAIDEHGGKTHRASETYAEQEHVTKQDIFSAGS